MEQKKPWYQSKLVLLGAVLVLVFGGNLATNFLVGNGVTPDQVEAVRLAYPDVADGIEQIKDGENLLNAIGAIGGALVMVLRKWFTFKILG